MLLAQKWIHLLIEKAPHRSNSLYHNRISNQPIICVFAFNLPVGCKYASFETACKNISSKSQIDCRHDVIRQIPVIVYLMNHAPTVQNPFKRPIAC